MMKYQRTADPGARVAEIRKHRGMTLKQLGAAIGKSRQNIWFYEHGLSVTALLARLDPIAIALHCTRDDLLAPPGSPLPPFRARKKQQPPPRLNHRLRRVGKWPSVPPSVVLMAALKDEAAFVAALKVALQSR